MLGPVPAWLEGEARHVLGTEVNHVDGSSLGGAMLVGEIERLRRQAGHVASLVGGPEPGPSPTDATPLTTVAMIRDLVAGASNSLGRVQATFFTCDDFSISGHFPAAGCAPGVWHLEPEPPPPTHFRNGARRTAMPKRAARALLDWAG